MKELTANEIESMCGKHLQSFLGSKSYTKCAPIDMDKFLEEYLNSTICYRTLSPGGEILGLSIFSDMAIKVWKDKRHVEEVFTAGTVIIDEALLDEKQQGRRNYTKAHEAVHGIINMEYPSELVLCYRRGRAATNIERMVDKAASKLLLPDNLVYEAFYTFMGSSPIRRLNPLCNSAKYNQFCSMAKHLGVSKKALSIRLTQLGLVEIADYDRPNEFLSIYCEV